MTDDDAKRKVVFIGVAGSTSSGKSTIARAMARMLGSPFRPINCDWYLDPSKMPKVREEDTDDERNWETPAGIRYDRLQAELRRLQEKFQTKNDESTTSSPPSPPSSYILNAVNPQAVKLVEKYNQVPTDDSEKEENFNNVVFVVVEGFLLYHCKELVSKFSVRFWMETSRETSLQRRLNRDLPSKKHDEREREKFEVWFDAHIWSNILKYKDTQLENGQPMFVLKSAWPAEKQLELAYQYIVDQQCGADFVRYQEAQENPLFAAACSQMRSEIEEESVPVLTTREETEAMDLIRQAEEAEERGDLERARVFYKKVVKISPKVAEFFGL